jgi:hypothetical protein
VSDALGIDLEHANKLLGMAHREASQEQRVNQAENGGVGADAQGQR